MSVEETSVRACCTPLRIAGAKVTAIDAKKPVAGVSERHRIESIFLSGGSFLMGDAFDEGYPEDGETPVHEVQLTSFEIDATCVTVKEFARFVNDTSYLTEAERFGNSAVFHLAVQAAEADIIGDHGVSWWLGVRGADWRHPNGPGSGINGLLDHPVVHVSHNDALAYCAWADRDLPTEAQWEYAARGGLSDMRYPWGNELEEGGVHRANVWQGTFPRWNAGSDGWLTTAPVRTYEPNAFGLYQMAGNVWEWCADWFSPTIYAQSETRDPQGPVHGSARVTRGGSYLCHHSYCSRYRVAARSFNTPDSSASNIGFRTAAKPISVASTDRYTMVPER